MEDLPRFFPFLRVLTKHVIRSPWENTTRQSQQVWQVWCFLFRRSHFSGLRGIDVVHFQQRIGGIVRVPQHVFGGTVELAAAVLKGVGGQLRAVVVLKIGDIICRRGGDDWKSKNMPARMRSALNDTGQSPR